MSTFKLYIHLDNDAMQTALDVADVLREVANRIDHAGGLPKHYLTIHDVNGNDVGRFGVKGDNA